MSGSPTYFVKQKRLGDRNNYSDHSLKNWHFKGLCKLLVSKSTAAHMYEKHLEKLFKYHGCTLFRMVWSIYEEGKIRSGTRILGTWGNFWHFDRTNNWKRGCKVRRNMVAWDQEIKWHRIINIERVKTYTGSWNWPIDIVGSHKM